MGDTKTRDAITQGRTLHPQQRRCASTVHNVLKPARDNRKLGKGRWLKGPFKGMPLYSLTLEERATCDSSCPLREVCYGNNMPFAHRFSVNPQLFAALDAELSALARKHPDGFTLRLHTLGDFNSVAYVRYWYWWLGNQPALHIHGFTHRKGAIRRALDAVAQEFPDRFVIRQSDSEPSDARLVANLNDARFPTCPVETNKAKSCLACGLCPNPNVKGVSWLIH